jgi:sugar-specific transcriptional regulator TrmB
MKKKIIANELKKALLQLDLTEKEIFVYLALLEDGAMAIQNISRATGINRVSVYSAIDELKDKGLVAETRKGKKKLFVAENPETLNLILTAKKNRLLQQENILANIILPSLQAINVNEEKKPQIKFFEGADGINKIFDEYILKAREVINCGSYETATKVVSVEFEKEYLEEVKKKGLFYRMILEDTPLNHKFAEIGKGIAHTKFLPADTKISADIVVFGNSLALISYDKKTATLIEDKSIAEAIKMYLDFMWMKL